MSLEKPIILTTSNSNCSGPSNFTHLFSVALTDWLSTGRDEEYLYPVGGEIHLVSHVIGEDITSLMRALNNLKDTEFAVVHLQFIDPTDGVEYWCVKTLLHYILSRWEDIPWGMLVLSGIPLRAATDFIDIAAHCETVTNITANGVEITETTHITHVKAIIT